MNSYITDINQELYVLLPWIAWFILANWLWFSFENKTISVNLQILATILLIAPLDFFGTTVIFVVISIKKDQLKIK